MNKKHFTTVHPDNVIQAELEELNLIQSALANHIGVLFKKIMKSAVVKRH